MDTTAHRDVNHGELLAIHLPESNDQLRAVGFDLDRPIGSVTFVGGGATGAISCTIAGVEDLDGLALFDAPPAPRGGVSPHPNGVVSIDHVVVQTPNPDRTTAAFAAIGCEARRANRIEMPGGIRRQTFHWLGSTICEVVGPDDGSDDSPSTWWGIALVVDDIDATARHLDGHVTPIKAAMQPGRKVCTLRTDEITTPILFMTPHRRAAEAT